MFEFMQSFFNLQYKSYWPLMIWIFGAGYALRMMPQAHILVNGRVRKTWNWFSVVLLVAPYVLWSGFRTRFGDTLAYIGHFYNTPETYAELLQSFAEESLDEGYYTLQFIFVKLGVQNHSVFFLIIASLQMLMLCYIFRRYSDNFWLCIFLFVASTDYMSWMHNGIRQFVAVCITFVGFELLVRKRYVLYSCLILLASMFHGTAILMLPFAYVMRGPILNRKILMMFLFVVVMIPFIDRLTPILEKLLSSTQYDDVLVDGSWGDDGTNIIRVLVYSMPALLALLGWRYIKNSDDPVANMCVNASFLTMVVYIISSVTSGIFIGRIPIYTTFYGYMIIPWLIKRIFAKSSNALMTFLMTTFYVAFFVYQMNQWGILSGR